MVLRRFGLKTGIDFAYFSLESEIMFSSELRMNVFIVWIPIRKKEKMRIPSGFEEIFCGCCSNLSNYDIISLRLGLKTCMDFRGQVWKKVWKMSSFGLK